MDNEKELTMSEKVRMTKSRDIRSLVEERCKCLGRDDVEECLNDSDLRAKLYQSYYHKKGMEKKKAIKKIKIEKSESGLPIMKIDFYKNKFVIHGHNNVSIFATMSEGLIFDDGKRQIPEISLSFHRGATDKRGSDMLTVRDMNNSMQRNLKKSVNSLKTNLIDFKTEYPDSLEKAVEYLELNFNSRVAKSFGFEIDCSVILRTRFKDLFERAFSGVRILTTDAYIG